MSKKFYASACYNGHGNWIQPLGYEPTEKIEEADVVIFGGGADILPGTYGDDPAPYTGCSPAREKEEKEDFKIAQQRGIPSVGICRGLQLLCALAGGKLIQDVSNHAGTHEVNTFDDVKIITNSIHHQMINPYVLNPVDYKILAWTDRRSKYYVGSKGKRMDFPHDFREIEACYFPKIRAVGFQYHPEMMYHEGTADKAILWTQNIFQKFMEKSL